MSTRGIKEKIQDREHPPYAYTYPPSRRYEEVDDFSLEEVETTENVNVYVHVPFCEQQCSFCGYLTMIDGSEGDFQDRYVDTVVQEMEMNRDLIEGKKISSLNFGGGTPSLLTEGQFEKLIDKLLEINPEMLETAEEVSIEGTPESVSYDKFKAFRDKGLNRASIGIQTLENEEIELSNRNNWSEVSIDALEELQEADIPNICCDLMYGLEGQTIDSWEKSVEGLIEHQPETIELYSLALVPDTAYGVKSGPGMTNKEKYRCYDLARDKLLEAGYEHDCHLRFIIPGKGFYKQQENAFKGESLIGFGAGARSYTKNHHFRNSYDSRHHKASVSRYMSNINQGKNDVESAVTLDTDEKIRRYLVGQIEHLDIGEFEEKFQTGFSEKFPEIHDTLLEEGLAEYSDEDLFTLTPRGLKFRDIIARSFFSEKSDESERKYRNQAIEDQR